MATMVVTGASAGIGAAAAIELTRQGHQVLATGRSPAKLAATHEQMVAVAPAGLDVGEPIAADLSRLDDVRRLAEVVLARCPRLDVLANNAGVQTRRRQVSPDGFELNFAVNHLAAFLLTNLLLDRLGLSGGRVVTTSSGGHRIGRIDFDDIQMEKRWGALRSYGRSKLANILFTTELRKRSDLPASCYHPGGVNTDLSRDYWFSSLARALGKYAMRTPEKGADTLVWLATSTEGASPTAVYYANRKPANASAVARDNQVAAQLWDVSAKLVGL